ncbi:hypothetical protein HWV62_20560 [Athelia sp. TMB]|nr:hypothetical protein HWV62_20560 [Athelia sp. TMB]
MTMTRDDIIKRRCAKLKRSSPEIKLLVVEVLNCKGTQFPFHVSSKTASRAMSTSTQSWRSQPLHEAIACTFARAAALCLNCRAARPIFDSLGHIGDAAHLNEQGAFESIPPSDRTEYLPRALNNLIRAGAADFTQPVQPTTLEAREKTNC